MKMLGGSLLKLMKSTLNALMFLVVVKNSTGPMIATRSR